MLATSSTRTLNVSPGEPLFIEFTTLGGKSLLESLDNIRSIRPLEDGSLVEPRRGNSYAIRQTLYEVRLKLATYGRLIREEA